MGGWYFAAWKGKKEYYLPKKGEVLSNLAKRKRRVLQTAAEMDIFVYMKSSELECFRRVLVKTGTQINSPIGSLLHLGNLYFQKNLFKETPLKGSYM